jgi:serine/threonine-protein kinase HipA
MTDARVVLWGRDIAAVTWDDKQEIGVFQYSPDFLNSGIEVSPITMPLNEGTFQFPSLSRETYRGLPGFLADSLPDKFGNALINAWLARQGRTPESFNPVERLCYIGTRGMGALEFLPALTGAPSAGRVVQVEELVKLSNKVLNERALLAGQFTGENDADAIQDILRVGTSAGGARAKAILGWNEATGEFRSGQLEQETGFTHWLMKFDGITNNRDKELADPQGFGLIEYAYSLMAKEADIHMTRCRLHKEGGRAHFMTRRFDRTEAGDKLHMQSLCALMHYDFNLAGAYSYEQVFQAMSRLRLPRKEVAQQFRRTVFNVIARNQDDHVKNIAFLMDRDGQWSLAPAFDVAYSYNPSGEWTSRHQMSVNGKRDGFELVDLVELASMGGIKKRKAIRIVEQVATAVAGWDRHSEAAKLPEDMAWKISQTFRLDLVD